MKNKKIILFLIIFIFILIILYFGLFIYKKSKYNYNCVEYIPEEEITEEQLRETIVTLYFEDSESGNLIPEARKINAKELVNNPYDLIINLLINGPKNNKLIKLIPENTKINNIKINNGIIYLDFSDDFINNQNLGKIQEEKIINSIKNTFKELTEINGIFITINGEENLGFPDGEINFEKIFY